VDADLNYYDFWIKPVGYNVTNVSVNDYRLTIHSLIYYESDDVANTIAFLSRTATFTQKVTYLRDYFGDGSIAQYATIDVEDLSITEDEKTIQEASFDYILYGLLSMLGMADCFRLHHLLLIKKVNQKLTMQSL